VATQAEIGSDTLIDRVIQDVAAHRSNRHRPRRDRRVGAGLSACCKPVVRHVASARRINRRPVRKHVGDQGGFCNTL
jgi:hypothetical protein